jgi:TPR repeat protein
MLLKRGTFYFALTGAKFRLGLLSLGEKKYNEAKDLFESVVNYDTSKMEKDLRKEVCAWVMRTAEGDTIGKEAIFYVGYMYLQGLGVAKDYKKAKECFEEAAKMGSVSSSHLLGVFYEKGIGVEVDLKKAFRCFYDAAEKGHAEAQAYLGWFYILGKGTTIDVKKGLSYLQLAANQNNAMALYLLGVIYDSGEIVVRNINQVKKYYIASSKQNCQAAKFSLCLLYLHEKAYKEAKDLLESIINYNSSNIENGAKWAMNTWEIFEEQGDVMRASAKSLLGNMYLRGEGVAKDYKKAYMYLEQAAVVGNIEALMLVGMLYAIGLGVKKDIAKAKLFLTEAAPKSESAKWFLKIINDPNQQNRDITCEITKYLLSEEKC